MLKINDRVIILEGFKTCLNCGPAFNKGLYPGMEGFFLYYTGNKFCYTSFLYGDSTGKHCRYAYLCAQHLKRYTLLDKIYDKLKIV